MFLKPVCRMAVVNKTWSRGIIFLKKGIPSSLITTCCPESLECLDIHIFFLIPKLLAMFSRLTTLSTDKYFLFVWHFLLYKQFFALLIPLIRFWECWLWLRQLSSQGIWQGRSGPIQTFVWWLIRKFWKVLLTINSNIFCIPYKDFMDHEPIIIICDYIA